VQRLLPNINVTYRNALVAAAVLIGASALSGCASLCKGYCAAGAPSELASRLAAVSGGPGPARVNTHVDFSVSTIDLRNGSVTLVSGKGEYIDPIYSAVSGDLTGALSGLSSLQGIVGRMFGLPDVFPRGESVFLFRRGDTVGWATDATEDELRVLRDWAPEGRTLFGR
jgi:hypothetical protein